MAKIPSEAASVSDAPQLTAENDSHRLGTPAAGGPGLPHCNLHDREFPLTVR